MFPDAITKGIPELIKTMKEYNETSKSLQKKLIFWTRVMAVALLVQVFFLLVSLILIESIK